MFPKFSIKQLLIGMAGFGVLFLFMASAFRGNRVAFGISVAIIGSFVPFLGYAAIHWLSFAVAQIQLPGFKPQVIPNAAPLEPIDNNTPQLQSSTNDQSNRERELDSNELDSIENSSSENNDESNFEHQSTSEDEGTDA